MSHHHGQSRPDRPTVVAIYRYPVKAFSAERLAYVDVEEGGTLPLDRAYAIENSPGRFDPAAPHHFPKVNFITLMRDERAATLETHFDPATAMFSVSRDGQTLAEGDLASTTGRSAVETFIATDFRDSLRGAPRLVSAPGHSFSDVAAKCVHIVNLASLRELEERAGRSLSPLRFRPNIVLDGLPPWAEFQWVGAEFKMGGVRLKGLDRTRRCAATNVDPATGQRDMTIPALLQHVYGHGDFGIYAAIIAPGRIADGDTTG